MKLHKLKQSTANTRYVHHCSTLKVTYLMNLHSPCCMLAKSYVTHFPLLAEINTLYFQQAIQCCGRSVFPNPSNPRFSPEKRENSVLCTALAGAALPPGPAGVPRAAGTELDPPFPGQPPRTAPGKAGGAVWPGGGSSPLAPLTVCYRIIES